MSYTIQILHNTMSWDIVARCVQDFKLHTYIANKTWNEHRTNTFVCLSCEYVDGTANANKGWWMLSFKFASIPPDVSKLSECQRMLIWSKCLLGREFDFDEESNPLYWSLLLKREVPHHRLFCLVFFFWFSQTTMSNESSTAWYYSIFRNYYYNRQKLWTKLNRI